MDEFHHYKKSCCLQPIHVRLCATKCHLQLQMVAYVTTFQILAQQNIRCEECCPYLQAIPNGETD
jgi:hypothetical protein